MDLTYKLIIRRSNGYRCCCLYYWDEHLEFDTLEEAVEKFPVNGKIGGETEILDASLYEPNGQLIGSGFLDYPRIKNYRYVASRWHGFLLDSKFDIVVGPEKNESWDIFLNRIYNGT